MLLILIYTWYNFATRESKGESKGISKNCLQYMANGCLLLLVASFVCFPDWKISKTNGSPTNGIFNWNFQTGNVHVHLILKKVAYRKLPLIYSPLPPPHPSPPRAPASKPTRLQTHLKRISSCKTHPPAS